MQKINTKVLMSGADYFDDGFAINAHMDDTIPVNVEKAKQEHTEIQQLFSQAGIEVIKVDAPKDCQDGVYTANWALIRGNTAVMSNLPNKRKTEEKYAVQILQNLGYKTIKLPEEFHFSGQGDALPCGNMLFVGSQYRTSLETQPLLARDLGFEVIGLQTIPQLDNNKKPIINSITGWPDSFFYDLDLALAVIKGPSQEKCDKCLYGASAYASDDGVISTLKTQQGVQKYAEEKHTSTEESDGVSGSDAKQTAECECQGVIAWCPEAFMPKSQERIRAITNLGKIEVSLKEAMEGFACNLVSTGESVIMSNQAPELKKALENRGLIVHTPKVTELIKGGGFIRCSSLTLLTA